MEASGAGEGMRYATLTHPTAAVAALFSGQFQDLPAGEEAKVFCFFSSEKKILTFLPDFAMMRMLPC